MEKGKSGILIPFKSLKIIGKEEAERKTKQIKF